MLHIIPRLFQLTPEPRLPSHAMPTPDAMQLPLNADRPEFWFNFVTIATLSTWWVEKTGHPAHK
jgi:hypothetical protein